MTESKTQPGKETLGQHDPQDFGPVNLTLRFDHRLPKDLQFAQIVLFAASHFQLSQKQIRETLSFIAARNELPESHQ